ncbi:MAG: hypothetical protein ACREF6_17800 [Alphaproteobacteria bacterium]
MLVLRAVVAAMVLTLGFDGAAVSRSNGWKPEISVSELISILSSGDRAEIEETLMGLQERHPVIGDPIYENLLSIWNLDKEKYPGIKWNVVATETVRIRLARILMQAWYMRLVDFSPKDVIQFARRSLKSRNSEVRDIALWSLDRVESDAIIRDVAEVAVLEEYATFKFAVDNLVGMCSEEAKIALAALEAKLQGDENRAYVQSAKEKLEAARSKYKARFCPRICIECKG